MAFSPDYVRLVLNENFEDAKALFLDPLLAIHDAHLVMLAERGIVSRGDARAIRDALRRIDPAAVRRVVYDGSYEDLFNYVDRLVVDGCGADAAGRLHTARSRNDNDMTMYRMRLREDVLRLIEAAAALREAVVEQASRHRDTIFAAHTHAQPAQPTTVAHYLLAIAEQLERDTVRLFSAYETTNRNPLGACAITGTGFPIDRDRTSALLGFGAPTGNTYGSIATVDYLLESAAAAGILLAGTGRFIQDLLLWSTREIGYVRLPDALVQTSSIMPQKRNPVALEHARAIASKALAEAGAIAQTVHNTPFGDIVDTEDDLQPLVAAAFRDATRAVALTAVTLDAATFDAERMRARAGESWVTITELADTLVRDHGLPFKSAHAIAGAVARTCRSADLPQVAGVIASAARDAGHVVDIGPDVLARVLSPEHFVAVRRTHGGPAPEITARAVERSRDVLATDRTRLSELRRAIEDADRTRKTAVDGI
jgi:argininosuccinate lyase